MKCTIPEISWHNREPVLSVDIHPISNEFYRLATGGGDSHVLIWQMSIIDNGAAKQEVISDLTRHQRAVNAVRWSPSGQYLVSVDDDANIIVWQQKTDNIPLLEGDTGDKEVWVVYKVLRGHKEDVYDICWSVNGLRLLSGSIDNTAILWDLSKGKMEHILSDHKGFVQGVAWDPKDQILATISTDRTCRIFDTSGKHIKARIYKGQLPVPSNHYLYGKNVKYFHDDTFKSFFRRLQFSPDGSLLVVPSAHIETEDCKKPLNATLIFTMDNNWSEPAVILPLPKQCSTVVRCCPILFELREDGPEPVIDLPYRMIIAIGTDHDVILYDTQQCIPFARFQEIHYTRLTDLTWSSDGLLLIASSTDGFCALITFSIGELGTPYVKSDSECEDNPMEISGCEELVDKDENVDITNKDNMGKKGDENPKKRPSFLEQWALKTPKRIKLDIDNKKAAAEVGQSGDVIEIIDDDDPKELSKEIKEEINKLIPRRTSCQETEISKKKDNSVAKPIAVRRKPKEVEVEKKQEEAVNEGVSKENKNKFLEAKPIAIRRTRDRSNNDIKQDSGGPLNKEINKEISNKSAGISEITNANEGEVSRGSSDKEMNKEISNTNTEISNDLRVEDKDRRENTNSDQINSNCNKGKTNENSTEYGSATIVNEQQANTSAIITKKRHRIEMKDATPERTTLKKAEKEEPPKIKVSSLIKRKSSTPTNKNNSLLNFLNTPNKSSKKNLKKEKTVVSGSVDLSLNEDEARDAWKCEKDPKDTDKIDKSKKATPVEEDCTEDFCLQLEDTQESEKQNDSKMPSSEDVDKKEDILENKKESGIEQEEQKAKENTSKDISGIVINISDDSNDSVTIRSDKVVKVKDNIEQKMPRRVALITLSSPKGKKKEKS